MEGNLFILFIAIVLSIATVIAVIFGLFKKGDAPMLSAHPERSNSKVSWKFIRENAVAGYLLVDSKKIPTYNGGILLIGSSVEIYIYNGFNTSVKITDVLLNGISIFSFDAPNASYEEKAAYAIQVLKQTANNGLIHQDLPHQIEEIILDVDNLNIFLKSGAVSQTPNSSEDYIWQGQ